MKSARIVRLSICWMLLSVVWGCSPDHEDGFQEDNFQKTMVSPEVIASGLNFPWGVRFIDNDDAAGIANGSVLHRGEILVANRGVTGQWANTVVHVDPASGAIQGYADASNVDSQGLPAVDSPMDVAFFGKFVAIANDAGGLGTISFTDPNPSEAPNGPSGRPGDPVDGPTGAGVFNDSDFSFIVLSVFPEPDAEGVPINTRIEVVFSQPVDPDTVTADHFKVTVYYSPMSPDPDDPRGHFEFSPDFTRVEFVYEGVLAESTRYKIDIDDDVRDINGFRLDGNLSSPGSDHFVSYFTTGSGNPMVVWVHPENGASDVPIDTAVEVGFSEPIKSSTVTTTSFKLFDMDNSSVTGKVSVYPDLMKARFVPNEPLEKNAIYRVWVSSHVQDLSGNPLDQIPGGYADPFESSFSTGAADNSPPYVVSVSPASGEDGVSGDAVIHVNFSEGIAPESRSGDYFSLDSQSGNVPGTITWSSDDALTFTPDTGLQDDMDYTITIWDVLTDFAGNHLDGDGDGQPYGTFTSSFSTGIGRLYVTSSYPADGDVSISINTSVYVNFSKEVNPGTVNDKTFYLVRESAPEDRIPAGVSVNPGNRGAVLQPDALLEENTAYIIIVTSDITDIYGNPLDQEPGQPLDSFTAHFVTGGEDKTPPCVVAIQPADGATGIPVGTSVEVTFSEPVMDSTVNSSSFRLQGPDGVVPGNYSYKNNGTVVTFYPSRELDVAVTYTVVLTTAISDMSGNALDGDCDGASGPDFESSFTTGEGRVVINEVVVDPQQDWNDSEGGNGVPFDATPGNGSITSSDEWIEIYNGTTQTINLNNWTLEMTDSTPEVHVIGGGSGTEVVYPPTSTITNFAPGSYLVIGNPVGSNNNNCYFALKNSQGVLVDDVEIGDDPEGDGDGDGAPEPGEDGNADSLADEAIARFPNGYDSDDDVADFTKQAATIGSGNGGVSGFGPFVGSHITDSWRVGMSGIVSAGFAPDEGSDMNYLYFATHTRRSAVYAVDFDDGLYSIFSGVEQPSSLEFIPFRDGAGNPIPGSGFLFVLDLGKNNVVRIRMKSSGPVGAPGSVSIPDTTGNDYQLFFTFPDMSNPVGIAYSGEYDRLYTACRGTGLILEFTPDGSLTEIFDTGLGGDALGGIDVGNLGFGDVILITNTGGPRVDASSGPMGSLMFFDPHP